MTAAWRTSETPSPKVSANEAGTSRPTNVTPIAKARIKRLARTRPTPSSKTPPAPLADPGNAVKVLPSSEAKPLWLNSLMGIQRTSSVLTALITGATLTVYGWTMYAQSSWAENYQRLEVLRHQEQQLSITNEVLKHQIAQEATQPHSGLVPLNSGERIFLPSVPSRPPASHPFRQPSTASPVEKPLGY